MRRPFNSPWAWLVVGALLTSCTTFTKPPRTMDAESDAADAADSSADGGSLDTFAPDVTPPGDIAGGDGLDGDSGPLADAEGDVGPLPDTGPDAVSDVGPSPDVPVTDAADIQIPDDGAQVDAEEDVQLDAGDGGTSDAVECDFEPCVTEGVRVCAPEPGSVSLVCTPGPGGCLIWATYEVCDVGELCRNGSCGKDGCPASGAVECTEPGAASIRICAADAAGFLHWSEPELCPSGTSCKGAGICNKDTCPSEGSTVCYGESQYIQCNQGGAGFLSWSAPKTCPGGAGAVCRSGACGVDECAHEGLVECVDESTYHECVPDEAGFLVWSEVAACPEGTCSPELTCGVTCTPGEMACAGAGATVTCVMDPVNGGIWDAPVACDAASPQCKGAGVCGKDQCVVAGTQVCSTVDTNPKVLGCTLEPSGFFKWATIEVCPEGDTCKEGHCGTDVCAAGQVECLDAKTARSCQGSDGAFYVWGAPQGCGKDDFCAEGVGCVHGSPIALNGAPVSQVAVPAIAALPDARVLVAWTELSSDVPKVVTRVVDASGTPIGEQSAAPGFDEPAIIQREPAVAASADGSNLLVWSETFAGTTTVRGRVAPAAAGTAFDISDGQGNNRNPVASIQPGGSYIVLWESDGPSCGGKTCILRRRLKSGGIVVGTQAPVFPSPEGELLRPTLVVRPSGAAWAAALSLTLDPAGPCAPLPACPEPPCCESPDTFQQVIAQALNLEGDPTGITVVVDQITGGALSAPALALLPGGGDARVTWTGAPTPKGTEVRVGCLGDGVLCAPSSVSKGGGTSSTSPTLVSDGGQGLVVAWSAMVSGGVAPEIFARRLAKDGAPVSDPILVSSPLPGAHERPVLVTRTDGVAVVVWETHLADPLAASIFLRILSP